MFNPKPIKFEDLSPKKLYSDDGADKVLAIIELMTNPTKYEAQLAKVRDILAANEAILQDIHKGAEIQTLHEKAESKLKSATAKLDKAEAILDKAELDATGIVGDANERAAKTRRDSGKYATEVKEETTRLRNDRLQLDAMLLKAEKEGKRTTAELTRAKTLKKTYDEKMKRLKERFEDL